MALPAQGKSFEAFQRDDMSCRGYASQSIGGGSSAQAANNAAVGGAVAGTALGAAAGAAIGSVSGNLGAGAAIGGATGLLAGTAIGANNAAAVGGNAQARYDTAYTQCMYANGNSVQSAPGAYARPYPAYGGYAYPPGYYYGGPEVVVGGGWGWHRRW